MPHHALEIPLTRPISQAELRAAARRVPRAANADAARLMALCPGKTEGRAAQRLRRHLTTALPIDVITTHYPNTNGDVLLNVTFTPAVTQHCATARNRPAALPNRWWNEHCTGRWPSTTETKPSVSPAPCRPS
nr:hypothetical protein [Streptomyces sp. alain-838]